MKKMTYQEISDKLGEMEVSSEQFAYGEFDSEPFGKVKQVYRQGGEGKGEDWSAVYHFVDHDVYIRIDGWYTSHYGCDFDNPWYEVHPKEKVITVYE